MLEPGAILGGKFRVERLLGQGGMGVVAIATHVQLDQKIALKVLHDALAARSDVVERFVREARAAAKLSSDHVCRVMDVGVIEGVGPYIAMELLRGSDLAAVIAERPLPIATAVDYVLQASVAIAEAHAAGIVHRDLKPANLFLTHRLDGSPLVKVLDFGIAKAPGSADLGITGTAVVMGSPGYMSPEQLRSARDVDHRTDIWALGVILYQLVSRRLPFPADSVTELTMKVALDAPAPLAAGDPAFEAAVLRCLEKAPGDRYVDVASFARSLAPFGGPTAAASAAVIEKLLASRSEGLLATQPARAGTSDPTKASTTLEGSAGTVAAVAAPTDKVARARWPLAVGAVGALAVIGAVVAAAIVKTSHRPGVIVVDDLARHAAPQDAAVAAVVVAPVPPPVTIAVDAAPAAPASPEPAAPIERVPTRKREAPTAQDWARHVAAELAAANYKLAMTDGLKWLAQHPDDQGMLSITASAACKVPDVAVARRLAKHMTPDTKFGVEHGDCDMTDLDGEKAAPKPAEPPAEPLPAGLTPERMLNAMERSNASGNYADAVKYGKQWLAAHPDDENTRQVATVAACHAHDDAAARAFAAKLTPKDRMAIQRGDCDLIDLDSATSIQSLIQQAVVANMKKDYATARALADKVLAQDPNELQAIDLVVLTACETGDAATARKFYPRLPAGWQAGVQPQCEQRNIHLDAP